MKISGLALRACSLSLSVIACGCAPHAASSRAAPGPLIASAPAATAPAAVPVVATALPSPAPGAPAATRPAWWDDAGRFRPIDVFELEWAEDPRISPDGTRVVYVRRSMDIMQDRRRAQIWTLDAAGGDHRPIEAGGEAGGRDCGEPRWSPDGGRLLYTCRQGERAQIFVRWMDSGQTAAITHLTQSPANVTWSPDGRLIAFTMRVPAEPRALAPMPTPPEGARWAPPPRVVDKVVYRVDGRGYLEAGFGHLFVVPADGGTPRQLTSGPFHHDGAPSWTPDGRHLVIAANRDPGWEHDILDRELYEVDVATGAMRALTRRDGPDLSPAVSPDGRRIAYLGFDDTRQSHRSFRLYVMDRAGGAAREVATGLDRSLERPTWSADGKGLYVSYDDQGRSKLARVSLDGRVQVLAEDVGGTSIGRPYAGGSFSVARTGAFAYTATAPDRPADVAVGRGRGGPRRITALNRDLLGHRRLGAVEELWFESSHDGRRVQGWLLTPPGFDATRRYPLILEIHGGPFANYGPRWSAECQLYAAAGYVVLYVNPRGSTSYGEEFGNLIHHAYPGHDYDDLMSGVDAVIARGFVDPSRLYVTGGSGGGVLTSWIVGKTDRFRAAVVAKPVINWSSFVLTADFAAVFTRYWFPGFPWEQPAHYHARSPLSLAGNVTTPTMLLTGEADYRTPISEAEQLYQALKLRKVDTVLVRVPGASHAIAQRPSQLVAKVTHILAWFDGHGGAGATPPAPAADAGAGSRL